MFKWLADRAPVARRVREEEQGFTLIELLVVVIIIGILSAIAVPVFLNQREDAQQASVEADARAAGTAISACLTEQSDCNTDTILSDFGYNTGSQVTAAFSGSGDSTTVTVTHDNNSSATATYDASTGNIS